MDFSFLSYAFLVEVIVLLSCWILFIHWRLSKNKKALAEVADIEPPDPFEVYLQFLNRELTETRSHLDKLSEESPDDLETIKMYQYRLKHLEAEHKAMVESGGEVIRFWEIYRSDIDFIYSDDESESEIQNEEPLAPETEQPASMADELEKYQKSSTSIIEQSSNVIELIQKFASQNDSEELNHLVELLKSEKDRLKHQLKQMEIEYDRLMNNAAIQVQAAARQPSIVSEEDEENLQMSRKLNKQNMRISELSDLVGNLSIEL